MSLNESMRKTNIFMSGVGAKVTVSSFYPLAHNKRPNIRKDK